MLVRREFRRSGKVSERFMGEQYQNAFYIHAGNWQRKKKKHARRSLEHSKIGLSILHT